MELEPTVQERTGMLTLSRRNRLVRWAYLFGDPPGRTSLCVIFWRTVLFTPLKLGLFVVAAAIVGHTVRALVLALMHSGTARFVVATIVAVLAVAVFGRWAWRARSVSDALDGLIYRTVNRVEASPLYQGAKAVKSKVCPLIEIQ